MLREPLWKGIVKGKEFEYMIVDIVPDAHGEPCLTITEIGSREAMEASFERKYGEAFVWPDPLLKIVKRPS